MGHSADDARRWMALGEQLVADAVAGLDEDGFGAATLLPGWTRRHLVAHLAGNAEALAHLVTWAATGVETPMYASPDERAAGIARGALLSGADLAAWERRSATALAGGLAGLTEDRWSHEVRTVQGRSLPATEIPWLRAREVLVHAVDLDTGIAFADLPADFLDALVTDVTAKRGDVPHVTGPLPEVAAWLAGRPHTLTDAPDLGPWL
ncbi:maleylpyruvate isomerase family mycothiol-dependent enzyme [Nocardioides sp. LHD-245]|uniref:maleylpyruvate isomerase family mycothiol-dependent enzyme n=1 Tax=Nocardioides sp. LHD-245 TaxID=3051387 RepID=UPI0027DF9C30|nr:maleylpyruvate isomerase family mycothiol-dependent enzyme [Nocardioides sp. LHD-245]